MTARVDELNGPHPIVINKFESIRFYVVTVLIALTLEAQGISEDDVVFSSILVVGAVDFLLAAPPEIKDRRCTVGK